MKRNKIGLYLTDLFLENLCINKSYLSKEAVDSSKIVITSKDFLTGY